MINSEISNLIPKIRAFLSTQPVTKAWLFGSCSRGEENPGSDIDILVHYDSEKRISLLTIGKIITDLECIVNRPVDLVSENGLMNFARPSVMNDRILIYERND
ncbi:nucleotidyltransferase family protein [Muribaculum intestinale]|uniref:nucleotidyltransferase family protein n=1 Tax=Muribaculum intestinale TaxID=1796646 RepID=UPI00263B40BC|nr:nucleotidyltransferase domain-containing protein [Muribaculum intestinale]